MQCVILALRSGISRQTHGGREGGRERERESDRDGERERERERGSESERKRVRAGGVDRSESHPSARLDIWFI